MLSFVCLTDEPGKQVRSAIKIKNTSKSHVAFKVWYSLGHSVFDIYKWWLIDENKFICDFDDHVATPYCWD